MIALPMDTAPRDGTEVLLFTPRYGWRQGKWSPIYWDDNDPDDQDGQPWKFQRYDSDGCGCCASNNEPPTAWLPLPEVTQ